VEQKTVLVVVVVEVVAELAEVLVKSLFVLTTHLGLVETFHLL